MNDTDEGVLHTGLFLEQRDREELLKNSAREVACGGPSVSRLSNHLAAMRYLELHQQFNRPIIYTNDTDKGVHPCWYFWTGKIWSVYQPSRLHYDVAWAFGGLGEATTEVIVDKMAKQCGMAAELLDKRPVIAMRGCSLLVDTKRKRIDRKAHDRRDLNTIYVPHDLRSQATPVWDASLRCIPQYHELTQLLAAAVFTFKPARGYYVLFNVSKPVAMIVETVLSVGLTCPTCRGEQHLVGPRGGEVHTSRDRDLQWHGRGRSLISNLDADNSILQQLDKSMATYLYEMIEGQSCTVDEDEGICIFNKHQVPILATAYKFPKPLLELRDSLGVYETRSGQGVSHYHHYLPCLAVDCRIDSSRVPEICKSELFKSRLVMEMPGILYRLLQQYERDLR